MAGTDHNTYWTRMQAREPEREIFGDLPDRIGSGGLLGLNSPQIVVMGGGQERRGMSRGAKRFAAVFAVAAVAIPGYVFRENLAQAVGLIPDRCVGSTFRVDGSDSNIFSYCITGESLYIREGGSVGILPKVEIDTGAAADAGVPPGDIRNLPATTRELAAFFKANNATGVMASDCAEIIAHVASDPGYFANEDPADPTTVSADEFRQATEVVIASVDTVNNTSETTLINC